MLYNFLDHIVWAAYRSPKLEYEQLPPLADYDRASYLKQRSFDELDPLRRAKQRHLFWGLIVVFWKEYCIMAAMLVIRVGLEVNVWWVESRADLLRIGFHGVCGTFGHPIPPKVSSLHH
jgi:hypothetical protein